MKATLTNYRQSPRKVRLVAHAVKGKSVEQAEVELSYMPKRAADPIKKLIKSAVANAANAAAEAANKSTDDNGTSVVNIDNALTFVAPSR